MTHVRTQIRKKAAALLVLVADNVFTTKLYPKTVLPCIAIWTTQETSEKENDTIGTPRRYTRHLDMYIECTVESSVNPDDAADTMAAAIEGAIASDPSFSGLVVDVDLIGSQLNAVADGAVMPFATVQLRYRIWYRTLGTDAETAL